MNPLLFQCPKTERQVKTGIEVDIATLLNVQPVTVRLLCPFCYHTHEWKLTDGLIGEPRTVAAPPLEPGASAHGTTRGRYVDGEEV
jgi:hypothetical protein